MSYTPTSWAAGDTITAQKLNKIEGGIEDANPLIVTFDASYVADTSVADIATAMLTEGRLGIAKYSATGSSACLYAWIGTFDGSSFFWDSMAADGTDVLVAHAMSPESGTQWTVEQITISGSK